MPSISAASPLRGVRVLEVGSTLSAPYCTMLLAELGADVVKVEPPGGDITRQIGPTRSPGMSSMFLALNAAKRSAVLDLTSAAGRSALRALVLASDIVVHNMRPRAAEKVGLGPEVVRALHPALVLCAIQGYATGSGAEHEPAYDDVIQAASGMISLQAMLSGTPTYVATVLADKSAAMMAATAVLAALRRRDDTGEGVAIEVPMLDVMATVTLLEHVAGETFDPALGTGLYGRTLSPHRGPYRTADDWLSVTVYTPAQWERFLTHIGRGDLLQDPRFADAGARAAHIDDLYAVVADVLHTATTAAWLDTFAQLDIPASRVVDAAAILADRGPGALLRTEHHPTEGRIRHLPHPVRYDGRRPRRVNPAPHLGEHTAEILAALQAADTAATRS